MLTSVASHLYAALSETQVRGQLLPGVDVWIVTLLEDLLQLRHLVRRESHPRLPLLPGFACKQVTITVGTLPDQLLVNSWSHSNSPAQLLPAFGDSSLICAFSAKTIGNRVDKLRTLHFISTDTYEWNSFLDNSMFLFCFLNRKEMTEAYLHRRAAGAVWSSPWSLTNCAELQVYSVFLLWSETVFCRVEIPCFHPCRPLSLYFLYSTASAFDKIFFFSIAQKSSFFSRQDLFGYGMSVSVIAGIFTERWRG